MSKRWYESIKYITLEGVREGATVCDRGKGVQVQVFEYNFKKNALKALYNFEIQDSLPPCSK